MCETTHGKRFRGECRAPESWTILWLLFFKKPDAEPEKDLKEFGAIALMSLMAKWYAMVLSVMLLEERDPEEWQSLLARKRG